MLEITGRCIHHAVNEVPRVRPSDLERCALAFIALAWRHTLSQRVGHHGDPRLQCHLPNIRTGHQALHLIVGGQQCKRAITIDQQLGVFSCLQMLHARIGSEITPDTRLEFGFPRRVRISQCTGQHQ